MTENEVRAYCASPRFGADLEHVSQLMRDNDMPALAAWLGRDNAQYAREAAARLRGD